MTAIEIVSQGATASGFSKVLVDLVKYSSIPSPSWLLPILAFFFSEGCSFLLTMATGEPFTKTTIALTALVGIASTAGAIGITEMQNKSNDAKDQKEVQAAIDATTDKK